MGRTLEQIIAELRGSGEGVEGEFSLDPRKAKEQLAEFLLPDPFAYVLLFVRAAVRRGCRGIDLSFDSRGVSLSFDGPVFGREDLERLYEAPFSPALAEGCPGLRELALGIAAAGGMPYGVVLTSAAEGGEGTRLSVAAGQPERVEPVRGAAPGTRLRVTGRVGPLARIDSGHGRRPEEALVRRQCRFAPVEIRIDGRNIAGSLSAVPDAVGVVPFSGRGFSGEAGFLPAEASDGFIHFVFDGVVVSEERLLSATEGGFVAVVRPAERGGADGPLLDASESRVVQNDFHRRAWEAAEEARKRVQTNRNLKQCGRRVEDRAREELQASLRWSRRHAVRYYAALVLSAFVLSTIGCFPFVPAGDFLKRLLDAMMLAVLLPGAGVFILLLLSTHTGLLVNPIARRFDLRHPEGSPLRRRMESDDLKKELEKARPEPMKWSSGP